MKMLGALATGLILTLGIAGCSDVDKENDAADDKPDYCTTLETARAEIEDLDFTTLSDEEFTSLQDTVDDLATSATGETKDAWTTLRDALETLNSALESAGLTVGDLPAIAAGQVPNGVDVAKLQEVIEPLQSLASGPAIMEASEQIQENAKTDCGITIGPESETPGEAPPS